MLPQKFFFEASCYDLSADVQYLSEQPFNLTMHYHRHRESTYAIDNRRKSNADTERVIRTVKEDLM